MTTQPALDCRYLEGREQSDPPWHSHQGAYPREETCEFKAKQYGVIQTWIQILPLPLSSH